MHAGHAKWSLCELGKGRRVHLLSCDGRLGESRKFERRVPHRDNRALTEAIREGVHGRVMGGEWREM